jgi:eukaryotic-like serine/threonine-protein kinase
MNAPQMYLESGYRLGHYEIVSHLASGGMGDVYRARDTRIDRDVAVKVLPPIFASDPDRMRRFEQEARAAAQLAHPNILTLHELGTADGHSYIVTELLEGETLREKLGTPAQSSSGIRRSAEAARVPLRKAIDYSIQIARGLAAAHSRGVIHRDLKPDNIFVTADGRVKILDFGLAKLSLPMGEDVSDAKTAARGGTSPGTVMGTVGYMSPEQVRGQELDHRTDIFSFGTILYEMLAGVSAFRGDSAADTMSAILQQDPPELSGEGRGVSAVLDRIVRGCLEKNPAERFHSAHDIAFALETFTASGSGSRAAAALPRSGGKRSRAALWGLLGAAAVGLAFFAGRSLTGAADGSAATVQLEQLTYQSGVELSPTISPDGTSFAYVAENGGRARIFLQRVGGENAINLTADVPGDHLQPAFSPDGRQIAFAAEGAARGIFVMGATGESARRVTESGFNPSWSPDGREIVYADESIHQPYERNLLSKLHIVNLASGATRTLDGTGDAVQPSWSPGGGRIAYWGLPPGTGNRVLSTIPAAGGNPVALSEDDFFNWNPVWSPDGTELYFATDRSGSMNIWRLPIDEATGERRGEPEPVTVTGQWNGRISVARDGTLVFNSAVRRWGIESSRLGSNDPPARILAGTREIWSADPSPDGTKLIVKARDRAEDLFIMDANGERLRRLTNDRFRDRGPCWWGNDRVLFFSDRSGRYELWSIRTDGSDLRQETRTTGDPPNDPRVSPDGRWVAASFGVSEFNAALFDLTVPIDARKPIRLPQVEGDAFVPREWSPGSDRIAGTKGLVQDEEAALYIYSMSGRSYEKIASKAFPVRWLDDRTIVARSADGLISIDVISRKTTQLAGVSAGVRTVTISPETKAVYMVRIDDEADVWMIAPRTPAK